MADELKIGRHWFHKDHYDIPKKRIEEIKKKCEIVSSKEIVKIIKQIK
jgi:tetrahydromethanopterin S-methyltransferase subunit G